MISRMEQLELLVQKIFEKVNRLENELCTTTTTTTKERSKSRSRSPSRKRSRSPEKRSPPPAPFKKNHHNKRGNFVKIKSHNMRAWTYEKLTTIFEVYGKVINCYIWKDYREGYIARVNFENKDSIDAVLREKDDIFKKHGLTCTDYIHY